MGKYDDIMDMEWDGVRSHIRMDLEERAKIFLPFAALRGFGDMIGERSADIPPEYEMISDPEGCLYSLEDEDVN